MLLENWPAPIRSALFTLLGVKWSHRLLNDMAADRPSKQVLLERLFARNHFDVQVSGADKNSSPIASGNGAPNTAMDDEKTRRGT